MPNVLFANNSCSTRALIGDDDALLEALQRANPHLGNSVVPYKPYCLDSTHRDSRRIANTLSAVPLQQRRNLTDAATQFGDLLPALAAFYDKRIASASGKDWAEFSNDAASAGVGVLLKRSDNFVGAIKNYQRALLAFNAQHGKTINIVERARLEQVVRVQHAELQKHFQQEMRAHTQYVGINRGSALASPDRGLLLASRKSGPIIGVADQIEANRLAGFARAISHVGTATVVLDAGLRAYDVQQDYSSGLNWQKRAAMEATGFAVGTLTGMAATAITVGALSLFLGATPVGWFIIIVAAGAAGYAGTKLGDSLGKGLTKSIWERRS